MPTVKLTKASIDAWPTPQRDTVYWDSSLPGFGVKVTPKGRRVFIVLYRVAGAGSQLRKYTIGPYGRFTLQQARIAAQKIFAARLEGRDPAAEKRTARRRLVTDSVNELLETFIGQHVSQRRSAKEMSRLLRRDIGAVWGPRSIQDITKRDVIDLAAAVVERGAPVEANKVLKLSKTFLRWCVGRDLLERSPAEGVPLPTKERARDRVLTDDELKRVIQAARRIDDRPYGSMVEFLALTGQRRGEVAGALWSEFDLDGRLWTLAGSRTKNGKPHVVHLSEPALAVLRSRQSDRSEGFVFSRLGTKPFQEFSTCKRELDALSGVRDWRLHDLRRTCVSGMARLGVAPHVADKILNHQSGTISGVAAVYQRHDFIAERKEALERWGAHVAALLHPILAVA